MLCIVAATRFQLLG